MKFINKMAQGGVAQPCNNKTWGKGVCHTAASDYHINRGQEGV